MSALDHPEPGDPRDARLSRLLAAARALPATPGVYLMKDAKGRVVYVGKAARLPDRVSSYFVPSAELGHAKQRMLELVDAFDVIECEGEWEALLVESRLIKDIKPEFNVRLVDDKTFPYLVITQREDFPRVYVTRNPAGVEDDGSIAPEAKGAKVFGPFAHAGALREAVSVLQRVFKFRTCALDIVDGDPKNAHFRPCILHAIGQCSAPCAGKIASAPYRADADRFARFLESKRSAMVRELREEMESASQALAFERAAALRDQIRAIEKLGARGEARDGWQPEAEIAYLDPRKGLASLQRALGIERQVRVIEGFDIAHLQGGQTVGSKVCFVDGRPFKDHYRRYRVATTGNDDYASIREVIARRYREAGEGHELYPDVILIDGGLGQLHAAMEVFDSLAVRPPMVISLAKKEELIHVHRRGEPIKLGRENPGLRLCQAIRDEAHRFAQRYHHTLRRKGMLGEDDP